MVTTEFDVPALDELHIDRAIVGQIRDVAIQVLRAVG